MSQSTHRRRRRSWSRRWIVSFVLVFVTPCLFFARAPVLAHKVSILAWVEGDRVYTRSAFSGGQSVTDSLVVVYDDQGNELLEGKTDEQGEFSFRAPERTDFNIVLKTPMGHMAEYEMASSELIGEARASESGSPEVEAAASPHDRTAPEVPAAAAVALTREELQALIDKSLDRKLAPIVSLLAQQSSRGPRVSEVMGGIGYILGLVGVALYVVSRRRKGS
ncbi:MAG: hypothetical protein SWQ30_17480 [Thermodesulfobacteriota bacterium]|nr:hypothetical protein [Thermodesulfobacteriota bacterium]